MPQVHAIARQGRTVHMAAVGEGEKHRPFRKVLAMRLIGVECDDQVILDPRSGGETLVEEWLNEVDVDLTSGGCHRREHPRWLSGTSR